MSLIDHDRALRPASGAMPALDGTSDQHKLVAVLKDRLRLQRHRSRNVMTMILSLLRSEIREATSPAVAESLNGVFERIRMQVEIERLQDLAEDGALPRTDTMLRRFCQFVESGLETDVELVAVADEFELSASAIEPLLMIVGEAVTSACRPTAGSAPARLIEVTLRRGDETVLCRLQIVDDRKIPQAWSLDELPRMRLVRALALQMGAQLSLSAGQGSGVVLSLDIPRR